MAPHPERLPGEPNPQPNQDAVDHVARAGLMDNGHGIGDYGIARGILALFTWRKRRKSNRGGRPGEPRNTLLGQ
jgi:hypothetical protein